MVSIETLRERAGKHAKQLEAVLYAKVTDLQARWNCDAEPILAIARDELPYIEIGATKSRRYDPADVAGFEERAKRGEVVIPAPLPKVEDDAA